MSERIIRVQPSELKSASKNVTTYRSNYIGAYSDIVTKANNLTTTTWGGADAEAFAEKIKTFNNTFKQMEDILQEYISFLDRAAEAYKSAQTNVTTQANNLTSKV